MKDRNHRNRGNVRITKRNNFLYSPIKGIANYGVDVGNFEKVGQTNNIVFGTTDDIEEGFIGRVGSIRGRRGDTPLIVIFVPLYDRIRKTTVSVVHGSSRIDDRSKVREKKNRNLVNVPNGLRRGSRG